MSFPPSMWTMTVATLSDVLSSQSWWKQQAWIIVTEIVMGFLAAWGILQAIPPLWVGMGLATVYAVNAISLWNIRVFGARAGMLLGVLGATTIVATVFFGGELRAVRWYGLCAAVGVLLAFRDNQIVTATAWLPLRARQRGGNNLRSLTFTAICSAVLIALCLYISGLITQAWKWWPHTMVLVGYGVFVPSMVMRLGKGSGVHHPVQWQAVGKQQMSWLLKLGTVFNAINFLGRRLVIPSLIVTLAHNYFGSDNVLPTLGATLGLIGILGAVVRAPVVLVGKASAPTLLKWGARLTLAGWAILCVSLLLTSHNWGNPTVVLTCSIIGWAMMEFTNRTWAIAYFEQLRVWTVGARFSAARAHRCSLHSFMVRRAGGGALGCALGGLAGPVFAPAMVVLLLAGCWWVLEKMPNE